MRSALAPLLRPRNALPAAVTAPVNVAPRGLRLPLFARDNLASQMQTYSSEPTLFACVNRLANSVAQVEWNLYRKSPSGKDEDRTEVTRHAALDLWNSPVPGVYTRQQFVEVAAQHLELTGESYWLIGTAAGGLPVTMWPIRPDRISPVPHPTKYLAGFVYVDPEGQRIPLEASEVIHLKYPDPLDPYHGVSPVKSLLVDLDASRYAAEWNRNFFANSAQPGGIIEAEQHLTDDEFDELRARWNEQHQGVSNAHRVAIIEAGLKWVDRSFSMRDMEFTALRKASDEQIMLAFGMSKTLLGQTEDVNRATAEAAEYVFSKYQMVHRLRRIQEVLNTQLLPRYAGGDTLEFDFDDPVTGNSEEEARDRDSRVSAATALIGAGFEADDVMDMLDLPRMRFARPAPAPVDPPPAAVALPQARAELVAHHHHGVEVLRLRPRAAGDPPDLDPDQLPNIDRLQTAFEEQLEALLEDWEGIEDAQKDELVEAILEIAENGSIADLADLTVDTGPAVAALVAAMLAIGADAADAVVEEAAEQGVKVKPADADEDRVSDVAVVVAALLAGRLATGAAGAAMRANGPGVSTDDVVAAVRSHLDELSKDGPRPMLAGALTGTQNEARIETLRKAPEAAIYAAEKNDSNTCTNCRAIDGKWLGNTSDMDEIVKLYPGGAYGGYVDCLGRERCRGTVTGVWRSRTVKR